MQYIYQHEKVIKRDTFKNSTVNQYEILKSIQVTHRKAGKKKEK